MSYDGHSLTFSKLKDTTTQMIETIWPLSTSSCGRDSASGSKNQNLIGLRTFVQEVLKRSKTSYSTLQVALYYLVLIQSCLPHRDFTMEQLEDTQSCRAMQCGRRMFLAALILASKYLQDRNFSARAWSKISGLRTCEINTNEMAFLYAVNWKLHIPEPVFHRWTDIVLKYSPSAQSPSSPRSSPTCASTWRSVIPLLTPDLDDLNFGAATISGDSGYNSPGSELDSPPLSSTLKVPAYLDSNEQTPTNPYTIPRVLEPTPRDSKIHEQILPPLPRLGPLPTPVMTPQTSNFSTPAVGAYGLCPQRSSMSIAMAKANNACLSRVILDPHPSSSQCTWKPSISEPFPTSARRSSLARSTSSLSSPESMISDVSSRSSRSSSISSVASSTGALPQPRLAVQATRRCAKMQLPCPRKNERLVTRIVDPDRDLSWEAFTRRSALGKGSDYEFNESIWVSPEALENVVPDYFAKPQKPQPKAHPEYLSPTQSTSTHEAAAALRDLALNRHSQTKPTAMLLSPCKKSSRKRERPASVDLPSNIQDHVRDLIAPRCWGDIAHGVRNIDDSTVLQDCRPVDSFLASNENYAQVKSLVAKEVLPRKRACGDKGEARRLDRVLAERIRGPGPGMWDGIS